MIALAWLGERLILRRWQIIVGAFLLGCALAGLAWVDRQGNERAAEARDRLEAQDRKLAATNGRQDRADEQLARAIHRLSRLENPTRAQVRRQIERFLSELTPAQARRLNGMLPDGTVLAPLPVSPETGAPVRTPRRPSRPRPPSGSPPPSTAPPPAAPLLDLPPIDLDGPYGLVPGLNLPPIDLPPLEVLP